MRPKDPNSVDIQLHSQQTQSHDSKKNSWNIEKDVPSRQGTVTPTLSTSDSINTGSSPLTPIQSENGHKPKNHQKVAEILPNRGGSSYTMQQMFDVFNDLKNKNELIINNELSNDSQDEDYRITNGHNVILHEEVAAELKNDTILQQLQDVPNDLSQDLDQLNLSSLQNNHSFLNQALTNNGGWSSTTSQQQPLNDPLLNPLLASNGDMNHHFGKPPGLQQLPQLLPLNQIQWVYLDPLGNIQGPFDGSMMQSWYSSNYLTPDLRLRRVEEHQFQTLAELVNLLGNFQTPFLVPLPDLTFQHTLQQPQATVTHPTLSVNTLSAAIPQRVASPWLQQQSPATDFLTGTQSPFNSSPMLADTSFSSASRFINTPQQSFISLQQPQQQQTNSDDRLFDQLHSTVLDNVLQDAHHDDHKLVGTLPDEKVEEQEEKQILENVEPEQVLKVQPSVRQPEPEVKESEVQVEVKKLPLKPKLAPWASSSSISQNKPKMSLVEIQELEAKERLKEEELAEEQQQKFIAAQLLLNTTSSVAAATTATTFAVEEKPALPRTASWATSTKASVPVAPKKTLADIQREEAEADLASEADAKRAANSLAAKLAESSASFANAAATSGGNAWTVITKKATTKPVVKQTVPGMLNMSTKSTTPSLLRSVSASTSSVAVPAVKNSTPIAQSTTTTTTKLRNSRDDFFGWCRQQLSQLNKGVNKEDVLSILIQLPTSSESQEIIADTIYSNSSVMDGRRFAQDFCKKKQTIEKSIPHGVEFSWNDEMSRTLNSNNSSLPSSTSGDNWDDAFKVVTKKNKKNKNREF